MGRFAGLALLLHATLASAGPVRVLVSIGSSVGTADEKLLQHARDDAQGVRSVFVDIGMVAPDRAYLLVDRPVREIREKLAEVAGRLAELQAAGTDAILLMYVSGHASRGELHIRGETLALAELREFASRAAARLRVIIVDACEAGLLTRLKGGVLAPEYAVDLAHMPLSGQVLISSSGPAEASQEWSSLGGSLFTHHLLTGLRGDADADGDGQVSLSEAYAYAYRRTLAATGTQAQHPAVDLDLAGDGELILTRPLMGRSALVFPEELEGRYVLVSRPRPDVLAEVEKRRGRPVRLALPPGQYLLRKDGGANIGLAELELAQGAVRTLRDTELTWRGVSEVVVKGGDVELRPLSVMAGGSFASAPVDGSGPRWGGLLGARYSFGGVWTGVVLGLAPAVFRGQQLSVREWDASAAANVGYRWLLGPLEVSIGVEVGALFVHQQFTRDRESELLAAGYPPIPPSAVVGLVAGPLGVLELAFSRRFFSRLAGRASVRFLPTAEQPSVALDGRLELGVGVRL